MPRARWPNACGWPSRTSRSRTAILEARFLWGNADLYEELRTRFWGEVATGSGQDFVEAKLAERDERHSRQGESRYLVEPNIKEGKGGLARPADALLDRQISLSRRGCGRPHQAQRLHPRRIQAVPEVRSLPLGRALPSALSRGPRRGTAVLRRADRSSPSAWALSADEPAPRRRAVHARLLPGRQGCRRSDAHLLRGARRAEQEAQALADEPVAGLPQAAHRHRGFLCRERAAQRQAQRLHAPIRSI